MQQADVQVGNPYASFGRSVAQAQPDERVAFIRKTYIHLAAAIYAFVAIAWFAQTALPLEQWLGQLWMNRWFPLALLGGFIAVSWIADRWARSDTSIGLQYAGLGLYVLAEAVIFTPLLFIAKQYSLQLPIGNVDVIGAAALITLVIFGGLTAAVFVTGKDFSFLRTGLIVGSIAAFGLILAGALMGFSLGLWFIGAMVVLACGFILYDTSNVIHHYRTDQHVAASLALFASVALLFWYVLQIVMSFANRD
jgi:FtsH-binding integral membrane protein